MSAYLTLEVYAPQHDEHNSDRDGGSLGPREKWLVKSLASPWQRQGAEQHRFAVVHRRHSALGVAGNLGLVG
jgi:hypothetical protein